MSNQELLQSYNKSNHINDRPFFKAGDTLRVSLKVKEGTTERIQNFEGICIARKNGGMKSAFTVRKISNSEGVERVFPLHSPNITEIKVLKVGKVRRAKLFYLRGLSGKRARIAEKINYNRSAKTKKETNISNPDSSREEAKASKSK